MSEWQPIETAPKDGAYILVWGRTTCGEFEQAAHKSAWLDNSDERDGSDMGWLIADSYSSYSECCVHVDATHWMPLPEPPK